MRGRKPVPFPTRQLRGNPGKRPMPEDPVTPPPASDDDLPDCPDALRPDAPMVKRVGKQYAEWAREQWRMRGKALIEQRVLTELDFQNLEWFCVHAMLHRFHHDRMWEAGGPHAAVIDRRTGAPIPGAWQYHPDRAEAKQHEDSMNRYAAELGMTPSARMRVAKAGGSKKEDDLTRLLGARA